MHELTIVLGIIDAAAEELRRHGGRAVVAVHVKVGAMAGVVTAALESAFEVAREGTSLERARLHVEQVPVTILCPVCEGPQTVPWPEDFRCQTCGATGSEILAGRELEITALEIES